MPRSAREALAARALPRKVVLSCSFGPPQTDGLDMVFIATSATSSSGEGPDLPRCYVELGGFSAERVEPEQRIAVRSDLRVVGKERRCDKQVDLLLLFVPDAAGLDRTCPGQQLRQRRSE